MMQVGREYHLAIDIKVDKKTEVWQEGTFSTIMIYMHWSNQISLGAIIQELLDSKSSLHGSFKIFSVINDATDKLLGK